MHNINTYKRLISFYLRKKLDKKYVIIESDDWGLERARDENALQGIIEKYKENNISRWTKDSLETVEDMNQIYDLFDAYKNEFEHPPVLTANFITHNIDYHSKDELKFIPISDGYNFGGKELFQKYKEGIDKGYFMPQLHGFSHYDTGLLKSNFFSKDFVEDFEFGFPLAKTTTRDNLWLYRGECFDRGFKNNFVKAVEVFRKTFGFYSKTFIPPHYLYSDELNSLLWINHIELLQSSAHYLNEAGKNSIHPFFRKGKGLVYSVRYARIDTHPTYNYLAERCIHEIDLSFSNKMPAIIDIHRVNFSGRYSPETRQKTIEELNKVFYHLKMNHPETIFTTSDNLINLI